MTDEPNPQDNVINDEGRAGNQGTGRFARLAGSLSDDDFVDNENESVGNVRPGMTEPSSSWVKVAVVVVCLILASGALVWLLGQWQQGQIQQYLTAQATLPAPITTIVDTRQAKALLLEQMGDYRRIFVQEAGDPKLTLISADDLTSNHPAFSPDGAWVAFTGSSGSTVVWTAVTSNTQGSISATELDKVATGLTICDWSPVVWSPAGDRLAAFACGADTNQSAVVWFAIDSPVPSIISASVAKTNGQRDLRWLTQDVVMTTVENPDTPAGNRVEYYEVK